MAKPTTPVKELKCLSLGALPFGKLGLYGMFALNDLDFRVKVRANTFHILADEATLAKIWKFVQSERRVHSDEINLTRRSA